MAVFVRERRKQGTNEELDPTRELDLLWVANYLVQIHTSITTWKKTGKNPRDFDELTEEKLYCYPNWQRWGQGWRNDYVWVQEYAVGTGSVYVRSRGLRKFRAAIDNLIVQLVGKMDLAEERTIKAPTAVVKGQLQLRLGPASQ